VDIRQYSVTASIQQWANSAVWSVTGVYGPHGNAETLAFLHELKQVKQFANAKWIAMGDFNLIYRACDKSQGRVNRRLMNSFCSALEELELKELHLHGRKFTWMSGTTC
jgi:exonuclease III